MPYAIMCIHQLTFKNMMKLNCKWISIHQSFFHKIPTVLIYRTFLPPKFILHFHITLPGADNLLLDFTRMGIVANAITSCL